MAQIQSTADVLGKGKSALFISSNVLVAEDADTATASVLQYWRGVSSRVDIFGGVSITTLPHEKQFGVNGGANINLLKSKWMSVSAFNMLSTPLHRRTDASATVWFAAGIISHTFGQNGPSVYGGYSATVPLGHTAERLFTSAETVHNFPIGIAIPWGKWTIYPEYNYGRTVQTVGIGIAFAP